MAIFICPHCKKSFETKPARICSECHQPILSGHKFYFQTKGGKSFLTHRHCDNPDSYNPK